MDFNEPIAVFAFLYTLSFAWATITPAPMLEGAYYSVLSHKSMNYDGKGIWSGRSGCAIDNGDGTYSVMLPEEWYIQNIVWRHENCHVQQYKEGRLDLSKDRTMQELECSIRGVMP